MAEAESLRALARTLSELEIEWVLIGALAANRYRLTTRTTQDVDLLLLDVGESLESLEQKLRDDGWAVRRASPGGELLRARHPIYGIADLIVAGTEYERTALARARVEGSAPSLVLRVLAPEDVILFKLIAGRAQDIADVEAVLAAKPQLDEGYLEAWARAWDLLDVWRRLRGATG